ncbi:DUF1673 family protein [Methanogenium organophilum]|uniref:DUF1673 family protein n=1 Tax=Methanogenium organophilum TaxID=2199 RepID=A0A9X9T6N5_METOG|nr:DUF1673 family protein [Methanogenium organophilum]WAI00219.1 DUF1673 family protein [Methanogenium organophilum]
MNFVKKMRVWLGWCPNECPVMVSSGITPERYMNTVPSGRGGLRNTNLSWWDRYRNRVMMMAVSLTTATIALSLLFDDASGNTWKGIVLGGIIGIVAGLVTLWHSWKRYERIDAGEFIAVHETKTQRMMRYGGILILSGAVIAWMVFQMFRGATHLILAAEAGLCVVIWVVYFTVCLWERRRHKVVIAENRSMYTIDKE